MCVCVVCSMLDLCMFQCVLAVVSWTFLGFCPCSDTLHLPDFGFVLAVDWLPNGLKQVRAISVICRCHDTAWTSIVAAV